MTRVFFLFNQEMAALKDIRCTIVTFKASSQTWNLWYLFAYRLGYDAVNFSIFPIINDASGNVDNAIHSNMSSGV